MLIHVDIKHGNAGRVRRDDERLAIADGVKAWWDSPAGQAERERRRKLFLHDRLMRVLRSRVPS